MLLHADSLIDFLAERAYTRIRLNRSELKVWAALIISAALTGKKIDKKLNIRSPYVSFDPARVFGSEFQKTINTLASVVAEGAWLQARKKDSTKQKDEAGKLMRNFGIQYIKENTNEVESLLMGDLYSKDDDMGYGTRLRCHCFEFSEFILEEVKTADRRKFKAIMDLLLKQTSFATPKKTEKMLDYIELGNDPLEALYKFFGKKDKSN